MKIEVGQIWLINNGVHKDPYLILAVRPKTVTVVMMEKYIKKSFYYGMVENIVYKESGLNFPSIPNIHSIISLPISKLRYQIGTIEKNAYVSIVNTIKDYFLGNIAFADGKYKYVTDIERGPSREYLLDNVDKIEHRDQVDELSPDIVVINIDEDSQEVQEDVKEDEVKIVDYINNENLDKAIEKMLITYGDSHSIDLKEMNQYYENYINSRKYNTVRTSIKHRKSSKRCKHVIFNKDTIAYIFIHTPIQISAKFDISYSYACNVKKLLTQMIYGRKEQTRPKTTNVEMYQNTIIEPKDGDYSLENLKRLNPMITITTLKSHFNKHEFIDIRNRKPNFSFKFTYSKEEIMNMNLNEEISKIKGITNKINLIVDATMYRVMDKISPFINNITIEDIALEQDQLLSKYNIQLNDIDANTIYKILIKSFNKRSTLDITKTEIATLNNLKKYDKVAYIKMASDICIRNAVSYNSIYKKISINPINYKLLEDCGRYDNFVEMIRSVSTETLVAISSITHNQNSLNNIRKCLDDDNVMKLMSILNTVNNKQRVPLLNIIHELSNTEFKLYALHNENDGNVLGNRLVDIYNKHGIKAGTSLKIIKLTYPLLKNYLN